MTGRARPLKALLLRTGLLVLGLGLAATADAGQKAGAVAEAFELSTIAGPKVKLADLRGKVVLIDFFASWCEPCMKELPELEKLHKELAERGVVVLGINIDRERKNAVELVSRFKLSFQVLLDPESKVAEKYDPPKMPSSYVVDSSGVVRFVNEGFNGAADITKLRRQLTQLVPQAAAPTPPPPPPPT